jgi:chromosome segregation ATPase
LVSGRTSEPRSSARPSARRVSRLADERDELEAKLEASRAEHGRLEQHNQDLGRQIHEQSRHIEQLGGEIARLRGGAAGFLRRLRARALRRG